MPDNADMVMAETLLLSGEPLVLVNISAALGSTPRDENASIFVTRDHQAGTIGGGRLEFMAVEHARKLLIASDDNLGDGNNAPDHTMDIALGPQIGQCCGGRVVLKFTLLNRSERAAMLAQLKCEQENQPQVLIFGAGHVGIALARQLSLLPVRVTLHDSRPGWIEAQFAKTGQTALAGVCLATSPMPEALVREAGVDTAFCILTHDHALDYLIASEALQRGDAAYIGMIGSSTKRANFIHYLERETGSRAIAEKLTCPIGFDPRLVGDKRPQTIAIATAIEIFAALQKR